MPSEAASDTQRERGRLALFARVLSWLLIVFATSVVLDVVLDKLQDRWFFAEQVPIADVRFDHGNAYVGTFPSERLTRSQTLLFQLRHRPGGFIHRLEFLLGRTYLYDRLTALYERRFPDHVIAQWHELPMPNASEEEVATLGDGRFSLEGGRLTFSPLRSLGFLPGDRFDLLEPTAASWKMRSLMLGGRVLADVVAKLTGLALVLGAGLALLSWFPPTRRLTAAVLPGIAISGAMLLALSLGAELYLRATVPFRRADNVWPAVLDVATGGLFRPGAEVSWTNGLDFWARQKANSLGFLDWEPRLPKPAETTRIALVGDSFVEAAQVELGDKMQTKLARRLQQAGYAADVVALGFSGTGQANQLTFFERFKSVLTPDIVVLVFVNNDFANNSAVLEGIRHGWHPEHSPRLYFTPDGSRVGQDPSWREHLIPRGTEAERAAWLREASPDYASKLAGWDPSREPMDFVFYEPKLPPIFEDALASTKAAFAEWKRLSERDGFALLVASTEAVSSFRLPSERRHNQLHRLAGILRELQIPLLDLGPEFEKRGSLESTTLPYDGHFNATGHLWAAEAIADDLVREGRIRRLGETPSTRSPAPEQSGTTRSPHGG